MNNKSKLSFNINYFDIIDDHKKAYWLGYIAADGCLKNNKVVINTKDKEVLVKFKNDLESDHKLCTINRFDKRTNKYYISYSLSITNKVFTQKLQNFININKSQYFIIPNINNEYIPAFIAGMFDGDGSIGYKNNKIRISLISTLECLEQIKEILVLNTDIKNIPIHKHSETLNLYRFYLYTNYATSFLNFIYKDNLADMYLQRKYNIFKGYDIKNNILNRYKPPIININMNTVFEMQKQKINNKVIAQTLNIAYSTLMKKISSYKNET